MVKKFFYGGFSKAMIASVMILVPINTYLCFKGKSLDNELQSKKVEVELIKSDNRNLANQLENAHIQLEDYQRQMDALNKKVLAKMQQAEERSNEIINELEKQKAWATQPVPDGIGRLLKQRTHPLSERQTQPSVMPNTR